MKKFALLLVLLLLNSGIAKAQEDSAKLPWGFSWDTTLTEYTQLLSLTYPEAEYKIKPYGDTQCTVTYSDRQKSVSFEATFSVAGGMDRKAREYRPEDLAGKTLQLESIGNVSLLAERKENRNAEMMDEFLKTYQEFASEYGGVDAERSYATANVSMDDIRYYHLPDINGSFDLDRIKNYFNGQIASLRSYGLFFRNEHAQYRLNVYHVEDVFTGSKSIVGAISILFTRESQKPTGKKMVRFP